MLFRLLQYRVSIKPSHMLVRLSLIRKCIVLQQVLGPILNISWDIEVSHVLPQALQLLLLFLLNADTAAFKTPMAMWLIDTLRAPVALLDLHESFFWARNLALLFKNILVVDLLLRTVVVLAAFSMWGARESSLLHEVRGGDLWLEALPTWLLLIWLVRSRVSTLRLGYLLIKS